MFNQHFRYMYIVLIEHTCITQNVLILICVLILLCQILVVYYRANFLAMFSAYITGQKSGLAPLTPNKNTGKSAPFMLFPSLIVSFFTPSSCQLAPLCIALYNHYKVKSMTLFTSQLVKISIKDTQ